MTTLAQTAAPTESESVQAAVVPILDDLFRIASSSWAGGDTTDIVTVSELPGASGTTRKVWSKNKKWSGLDLTRNISVMPGWLEQVRDRGLASLDGLLTTHAELVAVATGGIEVYRASWVSQSRGLNLGWQSGFLAYHPQSGTAYHLPDTASTAATPAKAARLLGRKLKLQAVPAGVRECRRAAQVATRTERRSAQLGRLAAMIAKQDLSAIADVEVTLSDSYRAGNCEPGTKQFRDRVCPGRDSATIGEIARRIGAEGLASFDLTLARQLAAACLQAIRRNRNASRLIGV